MAGNIKYTGPDRFWNEQRVETLVSLWKEKVAARAIAATLGEGVTRNKVIGKAHRLGLGGQGPPVGH